MLDSFAEGSNYGALVFSFLILFYSFFFKPILPILTCQDLSTTEEAHPNQKNPFGTSPKYQAMTFSCSVRRVTLCGTKMSPTWRQRMTIFPFRLLLLGNLGVCMYVHTLLQ